MKSTNNKTQIFDAEIVDKELGYFSLAIIPDVDEKRKLISKWVSELTSGRISQSKEEEIKPRFLNEIFGDVLGYAFNGANSWNARPEFKSLVDATKADAALGIFVITELGVVNDVIVVVEIKDFSTDLDETKNAKGQTAVDQAFGYAHKTKASWVIVSNFQEIRLYNASYSGQFEAFHLKALNGEEEFKRLMMLLHRQSLMDGKKSRVSKLYELQRTFSPGLFSASNINPDDHIIDQLWKSLKRFDGLESVDPYILANIAPFNILDEYVWHYENFHLFTLNPKIYLLLKELQFDPDGTVQISENLRDDVENKKVESYNEKLAFIFDKLRMALVYSISAVSNYESVKARKSHTIGFSVRHSFHFSEENGEGITKTISVTEHATCECINCLFRSFNFKLLLRKLKQKSPPSLDTAYGHYLVATDGYKRSFDMYETIISETEGNAEKRVEYFIANYNQQLLFNLISWYDDPDREAMLKKMKSIDLDELIYTSFNQSDRDVREALKELRDDRVALRVKKNVDEALQNLKEAKKTYDAGGGYHAIGNYTDQLHFYLCHYYAFIHKNHLPNSAFTNYQSIIQSIIEGLIISHGLKQYPYRLQRFNLIHLMEATLNVPMEKLEGLLKGQDQIEVSDEDLTEYLGRIRLFLASHIDEGIFDRVSLNQLMAEFLITGHFKDMCGRIFANAFLLLSRMKLSDTVWDTKLNSTMLKFLKSQDYLYHYHLNKLGKFIVTRGNLFASDQLKEILIFANRKNAHDDNTYTTLIKNISRALKTWFPDERIEEESFVHKAIADASERNNRIRYADLISIYHIVTPESQEKLRATLDKYLDTAFNSDCYQSCIHENIFDINYKDYFKRYVLVINSVKGKGLVGIKNHIPDFQDFVFYNFIILIRRNNVDESDQRLNTLTNLSPFERWLLNPDNFDYNEFDPEWLIASDNATILEKLRYNDQVKQLTHQHLKRSYSPVLAEIYFSLF